MRMRANIRDPFAGESFGLPVPPAVRRTRFQRAHDRSPAAHAGRCPLESLTARFPVTRRLIGDDSFGCLARRFAAGAPPAGLTSPRYGEAFPRFLRSQGSAASIEYVADIAELEMIRSKACEATHAVPIDEKELWLLDSGRFDQLRLALHPSVFLIASRFPVVTIWENNRCDGESIMIERWAAESALVARPIAEPEVRRLPPGGYAFIGALSQRQTIAGAITAGAAAPNFDVAANLAFLTEARVVVAVRTSTAARCADTRRQS